jgi:outer membrane protein assembly factor BamA
MKHSVEAAKFIPLFWKVALAAKVEFGAITADSDNRILVSDRFNPGGTAYDGIVRGYEDGSLTPDSSVVDGDTIYFFDNDAARIGVDPPTDTIMPDPYRVRVRGRYMLVSNIELQLPIIEQQLYMLGFFDAGNSWLDRRDIKLNSLYKSVGFGFRLAVPGIGTIGFDFGYPLDDVVVGDKVLKKSWKTHFQIGTTFR